MKLDLNNPWVAKLVRNTSTKNGCSFIRGVIIHYLLLAITRGCIGIILGWVAFSLLGGAYMYFFGNNFFAGGEASMAYFGDTIPARMLALSLFCGGFAWPIFAMVGIAFGLIMGGVKGGSALKESGVFEKVHFPTPSLPQPLVDAVVAWHHKFCPKIELILPTFAQGYVVGARVLQREWDPETEDYVFDAGGTVTNVEVSGRTLRLHILWDKQKQHVDDHVDATDYDEFFEEKEAARQRLYTSFTYVHRYWIDQEDSDWELIQLAPVEETSSPE